MARAASSSSAALLVAPIDCRALGAHGYPALFVVMLVATGALLARVPYLGVVVLAASFLDPVALVAGLGAALGELTGYVLGRTGRALVPEGG